MIPRLVTCTPRYFAFVFVCILPVDRKEWAPGKPGIRVFGLVRSSNLIRVVQMDCGWVAAVVGRALRSPGRRSNDRSICVTYLTQCCAACST